MEIRCICPPRADGTPRHERDTVTLRDTLDFRQVTAIRHAISLLERDGDSSLFTAEVLATLTEGYVLYGIASWSLVDEKGKPLPLSRENIRARLLTVMDVAQQVGDAADEAFGEKVLLPLLVRASSSSPSLPTDVSTSPTKASSAKRPTPSKRSSIGSSPTVVTEATSPSLDGVSSSSLRSVSAA